MTHAQIIDEIMYCFSGIPSTAAAIDELSCMRHWWCMKKLPKHENYKLKLSSFCSSLQEESSERNFGMSETSERFQNFSCVSMRLLIHMSAIESTSTEGIWKSWRTLLKSMRPSTRSPTIAATRTTTESTIKVDQT